MCVWTAKTHLEAWVDFGHISSGEKFNQGIWMGGMLADMRRRRYRERPGCTPTWFLGMCGWGIVILSCLWLSSIYEYAHRPTYGWITPDERIFYRIDFESPTATVCSGMSTGCGLQRFPRGRMVGYVHDELQTKPATAVFLNCLITSKRFCGLDWVHWTRKV